MFDGDPIMRAALPLGRLDKDGAGIEALPTGHILHALAAVTVHDAEKKLATISENNAHALRPYGPRQWLMVGASPVTPDGLRERIAILGPTIAVSDQSHGRARLAITGPRAQGLLARGCGVNFSRRAFSIGSAAPTLFNGIGVHVTRTGDESFEVIVLRSFAKALWEEFVL